MLIGLSRRPLLRISLAIGGAVALGLSALIAKATLKWNQNADGSVNADKSVHSPFLTEGFNFNLLRAADNEWRGPEIGEKIDLSRLTMKDGKTLADIVGERPIMVVAVNPDCPMCAAASDEMNHLREKLATMNITYYLVCFAPISPQSEFFKYSDSLDVGAPSFLWNASEGAPQGVLSQMTTPTHILLNNDGTVIRVWPGSYRDKPVRQRMARQIIADTEVVVDTLNAILKKTEVH